MHITDAQFQDLRHPSIDMACQKAIDRIRFSKACNFPLPYLPIRMEAERRKVQIKALQSSGLLDSARELTAKCLSWLGYLLEAPEERLAFMVKRGEWEIVRPEDQKPSAPPPTAQSMFRPGIFLVQLQNKGIVVSLGEDGNLIVKNASRLEKYHREILAAHKDVLFYHIKAHLDEEVF
jgi:hypothetical protein